MSLVEINFDGIVGPSHNYAGLSFGNLASTKNAGHVSQPRAAALQGVEKMRSNLRLGLTQGRTVVLGSEHDMTLVEDIATYTCPDRAAHTRSTATPGQRGSLRPPTKRSCSRQCAMPVSPSGVSSGGTKLRA